MLSLNCFSFVSTHIFLSTNQSQTIQYISFDLKKYRWKQQNTFYWKVVRCVYSNIGQKADTTLLLFYENDENLIFGVKYVSVYIVYIKTQDNLTNNTMHGCCLPTLNIATFYVSLDSNTFMGIEHQKIFNKTIHLVLVS